MNSSVLKPFINYPSYVKESDAVGFHVQAPAQQSFPAPGVPQSNNRTAQPVTAFSGRGVTVGSGSAPSIPAASRANQVQYKREVPKFAPPAATNKSSLVKESEERTKKPVDESEEAKTEDLEVQNDKSSSSKDEFDDLINLH